MDVDTAAPEPLYQRDISDGRMVLSIRAVPDAGQVRFELELYPVDNRKSGFTLTPSMVTLATLTVALQLAQDEGRAHLRRHREQS